MVTLLQCKATIGEGQNSSPLNVTYSVTTLLLTMNFTFAQMNPEFSGAYLAIAGGDITTAKMFDNKTTMYSWIVDMIDQEGYPYVETTILNGEGDVDNRLTSKFAVYKSSEDCYKWGPIEPECGTSIYVTYPEYSLN